MSSAMPAATDQACFFKYEKRNIAAFLEETAESG
jgi:hypothetical protein